MLASWNSNSKSDTARRPRMTMPAPWRRQNSTSRPSNGTTSRCRPRRARRTPVRPVPRCRKQAPCRYPWPRHHHPIEQAGRARHQIGVTIRNRVECTGIDRYFHCVMSDGGPEYRLSPIRLEKLKHSCHSSLGCCGATNGAPTDLPRLLARLSSSAAPATRAGGHPVQDRPVPGPSQPFCSSSRRASGSSVLANGGSTNTRSKGRSGASLSRRQRIGEPDDSAVADSPMHSTLSRNDCTARRLLYCEQVCRAAERASRPSAPLPANRSRQRAP